MIDHSSLTLEIPKCQQQKALSPPNWRSDFLAYFVGCVMIELKRFHTTFEANYTTFCLNAFGVVWCKTEC